MANPQMDNIFLNACKNGQKGIVETFVKKGGINYNKRDELGNTPLFYACLRGARDIARILIKSGADAALANNQNLSPLHAAAKSGNKEIMKLLTDAGADINATDTHGKSPLIYSLQGGKTEAANFMLSLGADKSIKDNEGHTALDYATARGLRDIIARLAGEEIGRASCRERVFLSV
jgi:ankyrin repeat protein